jgi:diguanylate cyclase (GGDEF)-like protein
LEDNVLLKAIRAFLAGIIHLATGTTPTMGNKTKESLLQQYRIDEFEIERRKTLFGFGPADAAALMRARPYVLPALDAVVEEFYRRQKENEDIALILGDGETMRRLRVAQRHYIDDLFSGVYDENYVNSRLRIGVVHRLIGVAPKYYLSAVGTLRQLVGRAVDTHVPDAVSAALVKAAIEKLTHFDTALVFDAYIHGMVAEIETVKEVAVRYARSLEKKVAERTRELETLSRHDALTGLFNRRAFDEALRLEIMRAKRGATPLVLLYVDIDEFKAVNDARGHLKGDEALQLLAGVLTEVSRESDIVARLGGDEFCVVLPGVDLEGAKEYCARFVRALGERDPSLAVSIGMSRTGPLEFDEPEVLLHAADMRMYEEKARHHGGQHPAAAALAVS